MKWVPLHQFLFALLICTAVVLLTGCAHPGTIVQDRVIENKVPVAVPCVKDKPEEVKSLRSQYPRETWDKLSTDQREKLLGAQAMDRKKFGDQMVVATAGCR